MKRERVCEVSTNADDMTGEEIAFLLELAKEKGALEAWAVPVVAAGKKPAYRVTLQCKKETASSFCELLLRHSTATGIGIELKNRVTVDEELLYVETSYGMVRFSKSGGSSHVLYEDLARIARKNNLSIATAREKILEEVD